MGNAGPEVANLDCKRLACLLLRFLTSHSQPSSHMPLILDVRGFPRGSKLRALAVLFHEVGCMGKL
jgi:hypothetical protein